MDRNEPTKPYINVAIRVKRDGRWYQQHFLCCSYEWMQKIVERLERKGREIQLSWSEGMGLGA